MPRLLELLRIFSFRKVWLAVGSKGEADAAIHRLCWKDNEAGSNHWAATPLGEIVTAGFYEVASKLATYEMTMTEFSGPITGNFNFSSNEIDSDVVASRTSRCSGRVSRAVARGERARTRNIHAKRSRATEIALDIDSLPSRWAAMSR